MSCCVMYSSQAKRWRFINLPVFSLQGRQNMLTVKFETTKRCVFPLGFVQLGLFGCDLALNE